MREWINAYKILSNACVAFCEKNDCYYADLVAKINTDVLGDAFIYCINIGNHFTFTCDFYEGGTLTIMSIDYFDNVAERGLAK